MNQLTTLLAYFFVFTSPLEGVWSLKKCPGRSLFSSLNSTTLSTFIPLPDMDIVTGVLTN